jgi:ABC-type glutathione transport system ATPase component
VTSTDQVAPLVEASHLTRVFQAPLRRFFQPRTEVAAVRDVSLSLMEGESLAIVGESGSGKSTLLKMLLGLLPPTSGQTHFDGREVSSRTTDSQLWLRRATGVVFQDPFTSLDPRMSIEQILREPLEALHITGNHDAMVAEILERVELPLSSLPRYPHEFSGGQRQRIALCRALIHRPSLLVGDEPVSALDVLVRNQILDVLKDLRAELNLTMLTVTHDLSVVHAIADRVIVMRSGQIVESGSVSEILFAPQQQYTQQLVAAVPRLPS